MSTAPVTSLTGGAAAVVQPYSPPKDEAPPAEGVTLIETAMGNDALPKELCGVIFSYFFSPSDFCPSQFHQLISVVGEKAIKEATLQAFTQICRFPPGQGPNDALKAFIKKIPLRPFQPKPPTIAAGDNARQLPHVREVALQFEELAGREPLGDHAWLEFESSTKATLVFVRNVPYSYGNGNHSVAIFSFRPSGSYRGACYQSHYETNNNSTPNGDPTDTASSLSRFPHQLPDWGNGCYREIVNTLMLPPPAAIAPLPAQPERAPEPAAPVNAAPQPVTPAPEPQAAPLEPIAPAPAPVVASAETTTVSPPAPCCLRFLSWLASLLDTVITWFRSL